MFLYVYNCMQIVIFNLPGVLTSSTDMSRSHNGYGYGSSNGYGNSNNNGYGNSNSNGYGISNNGISISNYDNSLNKIDVLKVTAGKIIKIEFTLFDVEYGRASCPYDHLSIRDKDGSVLLGRSCGRRGPFTICSRTNEVYFTFFTDCIVSKKGWVAHWSEEEETNCSQTYYSYG